MTDFSAWKTREAPDDFADRVLSRMERPRRRWVPALVAAAVVAVAVATLLRSPVSGTLNAADRTTVSLSRATVVAERGAALTWTVEPNGATRVQQDRGAAFYRVDAGEAFTVNTPYGSIDVRGTCFNVEVSEMGTIKTAATSAMLGAAITGAVLVTVYEGRVALGSNVEGVAPVIVEAGERAYATPGQAPRVITQGSLQQTAAPPASASEQQALHSARAQIVVLEEELARARTEVATLKSGAPSAAKDPAFKPQHTKSFVPSPQELTEMAKTCEIRIDMPNNFFNREPPGVGPRWRDAYGLTDEEAKGVKKALESIHQDVQKNVREMYVLVTGDTEAAKWLSPQAMFEELEDKTSEQVQALARQRISAERAGLAQPPQDPASVPPGERYMRWFTSLPSEIEARIAKEIGPERAKAMHDKYEGWQGSRWSMNGCPEK